MLKSSAPAQGSCPQNRMPSSAASRQSAMQAAVLRGAHASTTRHL